MATSHGAIDDDGDGDECDAHELHEDPSPPRKRWVTERDEVVATIGRGRNIADIDISVGVTPVGVDDVDSHAAAVATRLGVAKHRAMAYCDVGLMLRRMPGVLEFCRSGALPHERVAKIADAVVAVSDDDIGDVERRFLDYLRPNKDFQALPGPRVFARELRRIVESVAPVSTPPDEDETKPVNGESYGVDNGHPGEFGELRGILRKDRLAEFDATVRAIRDAKVKAGLDCSLADALMAMCRGDFAGAKVTMNIYVDGDAAPDDVRVWLDGAGWLPKYVSGEWLARASDARLSADSMTGGYVPTDAQKARVRGRDGGCRFPGCDVPAHRCQIDHVIDYDPEDAEFATKRARSPGLKGAATFAGDDVMNDLGISATWNMQCLCQHHHNLKTSRHWRAVMHRDASVTWVDHAGAAFATTVPHGPIAHIARQTFDQRATRLASTIHAANLKKMRAAAESAAAMERAELDATLRRHARDTAKYEEELTEFAAGPLGSDDPEVAAEARALADAADDGWPRVDDPAWTHQEGRPTDSGHSVDWDDFWANAPMQRNPELTEDDWPAWKASNMADEWYGPDELHDWFSPDEVPERVGAEPDRVKGRPCSRKEGKKEVKSEVRKAADSRTTRTTRGKPSGTTCRPDRRRATIDADEGSAPKPPAPLGPDPTIPF